MCASGSPEKMLLVCSCTTECGLVQPQIFSVLGRSVISLHPLLFRPFFFGRQEHAWHGGQASAWDSWACGFVSKEVLTTIITDVLCSLESSSLSPGFLLTPSILYIKGSRIQPWKAKVRTQRPEILCSFRCLCCFFC